MYILRSGYRALRAHVLHHLIPTSGSAIFEQGKPGVEVVGFFHSASGIGESARLCAQQLRAAGKKVRCLSVEKMFLKPFETEWAFDDTASVDEIGCRIIHLNPPMMPPLAFKMGLRNYAAIYNIAYWAWELEEIPREWQKAMRYINAIFCPSDFTSHTLRKYTDKPVHTVPHPVTIGQVRAGMRARLGLSEQAFLVSSLFSFGSALERKNPYAVVDAFVASLRAKQDAWLIFKSNHGGDSDEKKQFLDYIQPYSTIRLVDDIWDKQEVLGLIETSDVYLSLHRSEGFGLPIAEAMLLGTPTMVTDWSGSRDFCHDENSFLLPYNLVAVQSTHPEFAQLQHGKWADPDRHAAAAILNAIYEAPARARAKAEFCLKVTNRYFSEPRYIKALEHLQGACESEAPK